MRVALIPTGKLELLGLAKALDGAFPQTEFFCVPKSPYDEGISHHSFTSARLPLPEFDEPGSRVSDLVGEMINQLDCADLVIVLDDLELCNTGNEQSVIDTFRTAVQRYLERLKRRDWHSARQYALKLQQRASFHLAVPMIESWLFADPAGPANAGASKPPRLRTDSDPEAFETDDPEYSADEGSTCTKWRSLPPHYQDKAKPEWLKSSHPRKLHPKRYISWLCRAPKERNCSTYDDHAGALALQRLDWKQALAKPKQMKWLRALIADLADGLAKLPRIPKRCLQGEQAALTSIHVDRPLRVLRNL